MVPMQGGRGRGGGIYGKMRRTKNRAHVAAQSMLPIESRVVLPNGRSVQDSMKAPIEKRVIKPLKAQQTQSKSPQQQREKSPQPNGAKPQ